MRGEFSSEILESILRGTGVINVRIPYQGNVQVRTRRSCWQITSNAALFSKDLTNRSIICNHKKPEDGAPRKSKAGWAEQVYDHIREHQGEYLGAAHTIVGEWILQGKPRTAEGRHAFTRWVQSMDYIIQNILKMPPLMDDHQSSYNALSDPNFSWFRQVILAAVSRRNGEGVPFNISASEMGDLADEFNLPIPGYRSNGSGDNIARNQTIGRVLAPLFREALTIQVQTYSVSKIEVKGEHHPFKTYTVSE